MRTHPTPRPRRALATALAGLACLPAAALLPLGGLSDPAHAAAPAAPTAAPTVRIEPGALDRGPAPEIPRIVGTTLVDGDVRIPIEAEYVGLVGRLPDGQYLVTTSSEGVGTRTLRVAPDADPVVLTRRTPVDVVRLRKETDQFVVARYRAARPGGRGTATVQVRSLTDGRVVASTVLDGGATVLDADHAGVLLGGFDQPLRRWDPETGRVRVLPGARNAYRADLTVDRIARFTADPYDGGCTEVSLVSAPTEVVWRSCRDAVMSWSPDGRRMLTDHKLTDGLGPSRIVERRGNGAVIAVYDAQGFFEFPDWEDDGRHWIVDAYGARRHADVRCGGGECERVGPLRRNEGL
ncbi:hypothetical protein [Nocardioides sp.]|uniref:hypothetical protein n=1 Tax=Nocardioides sp. TaxID=35761 RepID=UPI00351423C7